MGRKRKSLVGQKFGNLTVTSPAPDHVTPCGQAKLNWNCRCDCGTELVVSAANLKQGYIEACKECRAKKVDITNSVTDCVQDIINHPIDPYVDIASAIICQAIHDYKYLLVYKKDKVNSKDKGGYSKSDLSAFFRSEWCDVLLRGIGSSMDGRGIMSAVKERCSR